MLCVDPSLDLWIWPPASALEIFWMDRLGADGGELGITAKGLSFWHCSPSGVRTRDVPDARYTSTPIFPFLVSHLLSRSSSHNICLALNDVQFPKTTSFLGALWHSVVVVVSVLR
jgi:hypothetical protein